jgi:type II secretory pathway predicted ATPase ExeA
VEHHKKGKKQMKIFNTNIDVKSMFRSKPKVIKDNFGISLITGYQGSGKSYLSIYILYKYLEKDRKVYTNIKSLKIPDREIVYFEKIDDIVDNIEMDRIFIIDEISKKYTKDCKQDKLFYSWLQQSRKRRRTVMLITQEYLQVPIWLRGVARFVYTTTKLPVLPLFITYKGYAVLNENMEWTVEPEETYIYKRNKYICNFYDTMEPINTL